MTRVEVIGVGDELVHGHCIDTNSAFIAQQLLSLGIEVAQFTVVSDAPGDLDLAIRRACERADLVITTGGIGPTEDDRTRAAAASAKGVPLEFREDAWRGVEAWFQQRKRAIPESNRRQAHLPKGARVLENRWGTAPGFALEIDGAEFLSLPGVPSEMRAMLEAHVMPLARETLAGDGALHFHAMRVLGLSEAVLGERLAAYMAADHEPRVGITAHFGMLTVRIAARGVDAAQAERAAVDLATEMMPCLGEHYLGAGDEPLLNTIGGLLLAGGVTCAVAESCTGGLLASRLTELPGISEIFLGGYVTYSNARKTADLGVPEALIEAHGAVSVAVAAAMARGAAERTGARLSLATTGIAGPSGGTEEKPVGTVCFGLSLDGKVESWRAQLPPISREFVRERACFELMAAVLRRLG